MSPNDETRLDRFLYDRRKDRWERLVASFIAIAVTTTVCLLALFPWLGYKPAEGSDQTFTAQTAALVGNAFMFVVGYFYGKSSNKPVGHVSSSSDGASVHKPASAAADVPPDTGN